MIDPLTGLFNRRYALPHLNRIANRSRQKNRPFAVLMIDLDHFKSINDRYGHAAGDEVLRTVGSRLRDNLRPTDLAARIGGEEFLVVLPETKWADARATAERLRMIVGSEPVTIDGNKQRLTVTASIGIARGGATIRGRSHDSVGILLDRADAALRGAKQDGRNRVIYARSALSGRLNAQHLPAHPSAGS
ncbi:MAG: diguanylate cyclase [Paracoccaceae bacterium]|nr:diguanylate cyclase [Paracoccaceae bacterium]